MAYIPNAICGECNLEMSCVKNGVDLEMVQEGGAPYYKIQADRYGCPKCGKTVLIQLGSEVLEHFKKDYQKQAVELQAEFA